MKKELNVFYIGSTESFVDLIKDYIHNACSHINVEGYTTTENAIKDIKNDDPDCVVSDWELPTNGNYSMEDSLSLIDEVNKLDGDIPLIILGEGKEIKESSKVIERGATDYIQKQTAIDSHKILINRIENAYKINESKTRLKQINNISTQLATETNINKIGSVVVKASKNIMGYDFVGFHIAKEDVGMVPIEYSERVEEVLGPPTITDESSIAIRSYKTGKTIEHKDVREAEDLLNKDTPIRSEVSIPLDKYGVLLVGSDKENGFSKADISSLELIAENAVEALKRREKRKQLEQFKLFVENSPDTIQIVDSNGVIKYQNVENPNETISKPITSETDNITDHVHPDYEQKVLSDIEATKQTDNEIVRTQYKAKDNNGEWKWFESQMKNYLDNDAINGFIRTTREITEQKENQLQLQRKNEQLDEFTSVVCHDLKNPLAAIKANAEMLSLKMEDQEELEKYINDIEVKTNRMENLINDMRELAKTGQKIKDKTDVSIASTAQDAWESIKKQDAELSIEVKQDKKIRANNSRLQQLFENLFKNAIKHGGSDVTITVGEKPNGFYVEDDGKGIDNEIIGNVFEGGVSSDDDGSGYGLKIVRRVAESHGWEITIDRSASGAKFDISGVSQNDDAEKEIQRV